MRFSVQGMNKGFVFFMVFGMSFLILHFAFRILHSPKHFRRRHHADQVLIHPIPPVGIEEPPAVHIGVQIEPQRPRPPEQVDVPIRHTAVAKVNEPREFPPVQQDVGETVVPVDEGVGLEQVLALGQNAPRLLGAGVPEAVGELTLVVVARALSKPSALYYMNFRKTYTPSPEIKYNKYGGVI